MLYKNPSEIVPVKEDSGIEAAHFDKDENKLYVRMDRKSEEIFHDLSLECAYQELTIGNDEDKESVKNKAECVAYMLAAGSGAERPHIDLFHIGCQVEGWDPIDIRKEMSVVRNAYTSIVSRMDRYRDAAKEQNMQER